MALKLLAKLLIFTTKFNTHTLAMIYPKRIEYILEGNLLKKCKTAILLYCFHTAGVLYIFILYNILGPGISFYGNLKLILKKTKL